MGERVLISLVAVAFGVFMIVVGRKNIRTRVAEESGKRRAVNRMLGRSNTYTGGRAVTMGYIRIFCGVLAILFGVIFLFTGPFLKP